MEKLSYFVGGIMIMDRYCSLDDEKFFLDIDAVFEGFDNISIQKFKEVLKKNSEINKITGIIGVPDEVKSAVSDIFDVEYIDTDDGYIVQCDGDKVVIYSNSERGLFYGALNLSEKLRRGIGKGFLYNYPILDFRMIKLYLPSLENKDFFKKMIDLCAFYGYNIVMLEIGGAMEYKKHPEINEGWIEYSKITSEKINSGNENPYFPFKDRNHYFLKNSIHCENGDGTVISQEDAKELYEYCSERFFEVIPEVPSFSHSDYLLTKHPELAERDDDLYPDTYCPSKPETYELLFDVLTEIIDVFKPKRINICHDELYSYGLCEKCKGKSPVALFTDDIIKIYNFLKKGNVITMMWSDKFLNCTDKTGVAWGGAKRIIKNPNTGEIAQIIEPTYPAIDIVPKDIQILHWYWSVYEEYDEYFKDRGFWTAFANFEPLRVKNVINRIAKGIDGIGISNWSKVDELHIQRNGIYFDLAMSALIMWSNLYDEKNVDNNIKVTFESLYNYRIGSGAHRAEILHTFTKDIPFVLYLDGLEVDKEKNIIGEYIVELKNGEKLTVPAEYGKTIGFDKVNRSYSISDWCSSYETDRRIIEPAHSCNIEFYGDRTFYRYAVVTEQPIEKMLFNVKKEYKEFVEIKEIKLY